MDVLSRLRLRLREGLGSGAHGGSAASGDATSAGPSPLGAAARTRIPAPGRCVSPANGLEGGQQKGICRSNNFKKCFWDINCFLRCPTAVLRIWRGRVAGNHSGLEEFLAGSQGSPHPGHLSHALVPGSGFPSTDIRASRAARRAHSAASWYRWYRSSGGS